MEPITVIKKNLEGEETFRYSGEVLERSSKYILLEAYFNRPDMPFHGIVLGKNDRFVETYYIDRWYNIFEIHDRQDNYLKGWYCNVSYPAVIGENTVSYIDLALDLLVFPDGRQQILDEDEFTALSLTLNARKQAQASLRELQQIFNEKLGRR
jgi:uncharacterized protein